MRKRGERERERESVCVYGKQVEALSSLRILRIRIAKAAFWVRLEIGIGLHECALMHLLGKPYPFSFLWGLETSLHK